MVDFTFQRRYVRGKYAQDQLGVHDVIFFLVHLLVVCRDGLARAVDGEATTPLDDEAWTSMDIPLSDITLSVLKLVSTSLTNSSTALSLTDM
jgi:hypothetical protein